jgi:HK97 gp10 family phage protein
MTGLIEMKVTGIDEMIADMKRLRMELQKELRKAIREAAKKIAAIARGKFIANYEQHSGEGAKSIGVKVGVNEDGDIYALITAGGGKAFYMPFLCLGTKKIKAKPYLRPAIDENRERFIHDVEKALKTAIDKELRGG